MTDVILQSRTHPHSRPMPDGAPSDDSNDSILALIELFFFAYRDFTGDVDALLQSDGFGRAHHRVLHFVHRQPGLRVADLLDILGITKQSLGRVLRQLVERDFVEQRTGAKDRRERRLYATDKGTDLALRLASLQQKRVTAALDTLPENGAGIARSFLLAMVNPEDRAAVRSLIGVDETTR